MPHFFFRLVPPRPSFALDMNDTERALMRTHAQYLHGLMKQGHMVLFGPVLDPKGPYGVAVGRAADAAAARALADADPVIKANLGFAYEISPFQAVTPENAAERFPAG